MRLFVGSAVPPDVAHCLARAAAEALLPAASSPASRIRYTQAKDMHITVSFLGRVEADRLPLLEQALRTFPFSPLEITVGEAGTFPEAGVVYASIVAGPGLTGLAEQTAMVMEQCGIERDSRPYTPHITLARVSGLLPQLKNIEVPRSTFRADAMHLYHSTPAPGHGPRYRILFSLRGEGGA